jgi:hypothetical protein
MANYFSPSVCDLGGILQPHNPMDARLGFRGDRINRIIDSARLSPVTDIYDPDYGISAPGRLNGVGGIQDVLSVLSAVDFLFPSQK